MTANHASEASLTVILPCAGSARRFGAPYPKELHRVGDQDSVIDLALTPVCAFAAGASGRVRAVVVIAPHRSATVEYLFRYADQLDLVFVYQTAKHGEELAGAVEAALPFCLGPTALVLPDQVICDRWRDKRFAEAVELLATHRCSVLAALTGNPDRLAGEGALDVRQEGDTPLVAAAMEKPSDTAMYNAAWVTLLARPEARRLLREAVTPTGAHALVGGAAVLVDDFVNVNRVTDL